MLVLQQVYMSNVGYIGDNLNNKVPYDYYVLDKSGVDSYCSTSASGLDLHWAKDLKSMIGLSNISFDILNTETNRLAEGARLRDIYYKIDEIFGIILIDTDYVFVSITKNVWNFLDIVNEPIHLADDEFMKDYDNISIDIYFNRLSSSNKVVYVFKEYFKLIDRDGMFWITADNNILTILSVYINIFSKINSDDLNKNIEVYIQSNFKNIIKLDFSKEVIRFLVKLNTLRR